jgi:hypothetical protein
VVVVMGPTGCRYRGARLDPSLSGDGLKAFLCDSVLLWMKLFGGATLLRTPSCCSADPYFNFPELEDLLSLLIPCHARETSVVILSSR